MLPPRFMHRFFELFFRHRWLNLLPVFAMLPAVFLFLIEPVYVSRASIYIESTNLLETLTRVSYFDPSVVSVATPAKSVVDEFDELLQTDAFAFAVINGSDWRDRLSGSPDDQREVLRRYREALSLSAEGDKLVRLEVKADSPELAFQLASSTVNAYRSWKISQDVQDGQIAQLFFEEIIASYQEDLDDARDALRFYLEQYPEPAVGARPVEEAIQLDTLWQAVRVAEDRLNSVFSKAESARLALAQSERDVDQTYRVIDEPAVPPVAEPVVQQLLLALTFPVLGLILSFLTVLGRTVADKTILNAIDVAAEFELPVLAAVPARRKGDRGKGRQQRTNPSAPADDAVKGPAHA